MNKRAKIKISLVVKIKQLVQLEINHAGKLGLLARKIHNKLYNFILVLMVLQNILDFMPNLFSVGFLKAHLPRNIIPFTSTPYLGPIL